jgi:pimeloyl-ACP methyl ester carboxylesterase
VQDSVEPRAQFVRANGLVHHVLTWSPDHARGTVVLCHGFLDLAYGFANLAPSLCEAGWRVLAIDFRGHGESGHLADGGYYYFPDYVLDLHMLLPQLCSEPLHLVGHSMGGTVSALYAATHGSQLRSLSLLEGWGPPEDEPSAAPARIRSWLEQASAVRARQPVQLRDLDEAYTRLAARHKRVDEPFLRMLARRATCPHPSGTGLRWRFDPLHLTTSPVPFDAGRFEHCLAQITCPTLALQGERGFRVPDQAERLAAVPRARTETIAGAGHMLHWTHAAEVAPLLLEHFAST